MAFLAGLLWGFIVGFCLAVKLSGMILRKRGYDGFDDLPDKDDRSNHNI